MTYFFLFIVVFDTFETRRPVSMTPDSLCILLFQNNSVFGSVARIPAECEIDICTFISRWEAFAVRARMCFVFEIFKWERQFPKKVYRTVIIGKRRERCWLENGCRLRDNETLWSDVVSERVGSCIRREHDDVGKTRVSGARACARVAECCPWGLSDLKGGHCVTKLEFRAYQYVTFRYPNFFRAVFYYVYHIIIDFSDYTE